MTATLRTDSNCFLGYNRSHVKRGEGEPERLPQIGFFFRSLIRPKRSDQNYISIKSG